MLDHRLLIVSDSLGSNGNIRYLVATHTQSLLVYENMTLKWAAQMTSTPVQIKVGAFKWVFTLHLIEKHSSC